VGTSMRLSGKLDVGGKIEVKDVLSAKIIDVGGSLKAHEVTAKDEVSVGGLINTVVGVNASFVEIGRRGKVTGPIRANEVLVGERACVEDVYADEITMEMNAEARNLYGKRIRVESGCRIGGEVRFIESLESEKGVFYSKPPVKVEKLPKQVF